MKIGRACISHLNSSWTEPASIVVVVVSEDGRGCSLALPNPAHTVVDGDFFFWGGEHLNGVCVDSLAVARVPMNGCDAK